MVRLLSIITLLFVAATSVQADGYCQCLYADGSHCCVLEYGIRKDCTNLCMNAGNSDRKCDAGGKYSDVSTWNGGWRRGCQGKPGWE